MNADLFDESKVPSVGWDEGTPVPPVHAEEDGRRIYDQGSALQLILQRQAKIMDFCVRIEKRLARLEPTSAEGPVKQETSHVPVYFDRTKFHIRKGNWEGDSLRAHWNVKEDQDLWIQWGIGPSAMRVEENTTFGIKGEEKFFTVPRFINN